MSTRLMSCVSKPRKAAASLRALWRDEKGVSILEFALALPFMLTAGLYGFELSRMISVNMQISQLAVSIADNASRLGQTDNSAVTPTVAEADIDAIMFGAMTGAGSIDLEENGRIILSSLERHPGTGRQYIHWQRCAGDLNEQSSYGNDSNDNGLTGPAWPGLGRDDQIVTAEANRAVMFVEIFYEYEPIFGSSFTETKVFRHEGAFVVRDDRNLSGGGGDGLTGTGTSEC